MIYALNFLGTILIGALAPLVAPYTTRYGLSKLEIGALVASPGVATLMLSIPIGLTADRIGSRRLTLLATGLLVACGLAHAAVSDYWSLLAVWLGFGIAIALISTASLAWLSDTAPPRRRTAALSAVGASAGVGLVVGPALVGLAVQHVGLDMPFLVIASVAVPVLARLIVTPAPSSVVSDGRRRLKSLVGVARGDSQMLGAFVMMLVCGAQGGTISLLIGLRLHAHGLSAGDVGLAFSVSLIGFVIVSSGLVALGHRVARVEMGALAACLLGAALVLPIAVDATPAVIVFLVIRAALWATLSTLSLPIAADGAYRASIGRGGVIGILMVAWAIGAVGGPMVAGLVAQAISIDAALAALAAFCFAAAVCILLLSLRIRPAHAAIRP